MAVILVVEDDPPIAALIAHKMGRLNHTVHTATDGVSGLELARQVRPDLVLLDWMLPEMTGIEVCARLRQQGLADVPIAILSARIQSDDVAAGLSAGATMYITKPFSPRQLAEHVTEMLAAGGR